MRDIGNEHGALETLSWGGPIAPLLPRSLRTAWSLEPLPHWVKNDLRLEETATVGSLSGGLRGVRDGLPERVRSYITFLVQSRQASIEPVVVFGRPWPAGYHFEEVPWRTRTRNCLVNARFDERLNELPRMTFGDLRAIRGLGTQSLLDFACTLEAVVDHSLAPRPARPEELDEPDEGEAISATLLGVLREPWADWISEQDPRFAALLPLGDGTVAERVDRLTADPDAS